MFNDILHILYILHLFFLHYTGDKFIAFMGQTSSSKKPVYITSVIVQDNSASSVISAGREAIKIAEEWGCKVIALVGDNAPSMQLGLR